MIAQHYDVCLACGPPRTDLGFIPGIPYGPLILPGVIDKWKARSNPGVLLGMAQTNKQNKNEQNISEKFHTMNSKMNLINSKIVKNKSKINN